MRRPSTSETLAWTLVGAAIGVVTGFVLGEILGPVDRGRVSGLLKREVPKPRLRPAEVVHAVRAELSLDSALQLLELEPLSVGSGIVELHGWVPSRAVRASAVRVAAAAPGVDRLVDRLLVRGEDDVPPSRSETGKPA